MRQQKQARETNKQANETNKQARFFLKKQGAVETIKAKGTTTKQVNYTT